MQLRRRARGIGSRAQPPVNQKSDLHFLDNFARGIGHHYYLT